MPGVHRIADVSTLRHLKRRPVVQRYRAVVGPPLPGAQEGPSPCRVSKKLYVAAARSSAFAYGSANRGGDPACSSLPCVVESPDVVGASPRPSRRAIGRRRPIRVMESPVRIAPRLLVQDPLATAGAVVLDCRPPLLPRTMNTSGVYLAEIQSSTMASEADTVPPDTVIRGRGLAEFDLSGFRCRSADRSWNCSGRQTVRQTADSPAAADHGVAPLSAPADVDIDLGQVFGDVGSLPAMVTPVYGVIVAQPPVVTSPAGPTVTSPGFLNSSTGSVGCSSVPPTILAVSTLEKSLLLEAAEMTQGQPWGGESGGGGVGG